MPDEVTTGVGVDNMPGGSAASASPSDEPSATDQPDVTSTVVDATPGTQADQTAEGQTTDTAQPVDLTEQDVSTLAPKAQQAFARMRTETRTLSEENSTLKAQLSELQTNAPAIAIDAPVEEWNGLEQFDRLPAPYREKLGDEIGWRRLPTLLDTALSNVDQLPPKWQEAIVEPLLKSVGAEFGMTPQQVIQTLQNASGQGGGEYQPPAQSSQPHALSQQLIAEGYEPNSPIVLAARQQEQGLTQAQRQLQQFEQRIGKFENDNKAQTKAQQEAAERQREAEFNSKRDATWETILGPTLKTIPQGYERYRRSVTVEAKDTVAADSVAQNHLTNAKSALTQAHQYRAQGTPELADRAIDKHSREMTAYAARCAVLSQQVAKAYNDLITENVSLKNGATNQQQQRKDLLGGGGNGQNGNGAPEPRRRDPQTGQYTESLDEAIARAQEWRRARSAEIDASR
jgi:hypothetical protein